MVEPTRRFQTNQDESSVQARIRERLQEIVDHIKNDRGVQLQREVADILGVDDATLSHWLSGNRLPKVKELRAIAERTGFSSDYVLAVEATPSGVRNLVEGIEWLDLSSLSGVQVSDHCVEGCQTFRALMSGKSPDEIVEGYRGRDGDKPTWSTCIQYWQAAVKSNVLKILSVQRRDDLENDLQEAYGKRIQDVHVAHIPEHITDPTIRTEFLAILAAPVLAEMNGAIGIGAGYSLIRTIENTSPSVGTGRTWCPVIVQREFAAEGLRTHTAGYNANALGNRFPGSKPLHLPFLPPEDRHPVDYNKWHSHRDAIEYVIHPLYHGLQAIFASLGAIPEEGGAYRDAPDVTPKVPASYRSQLDDYTRLDMRDKVLGEFLGHLLNADGDEIGSEQERTLLSKEVFHTSLSELRIFVNRRPVYVLAHSFKKYAAAAVLKGGLANSLIIDQDVAQHLLRTAPAASPDA